MEVFDREWWEACMEARLAPVRRPAREGKAETQFWGEDGHLWTMKRSRWDYCVWEGKRYGQWWRIVMHPCLYILIGEWDRRTGWRGQISGFDVRPENGSLLLGVSEMASKYLKAAAARCAGKANETTANDPVVFKGRPAVTEYMTLATGDDGKPRELSVLMVAADGAGFRVGLKDEEAGGWCWRTGTTVSKALDAVEAALTGDEPAFRTAGGGRGKGGQRRG